MQAKHRAKLDQKQREAVRKKDASQKAKKWANMSEEQKDTVREKNRLRKKWTRERMKEEHKQDLRKGIKAQNLTQGEDPSARERKKKSRANRSEDKIEYDRIEKLLLMRRRRQEQDGKEHLLKNLASKKRMRALRESRLLDEEKPWITRRRKGEREEVKNWRLFCLNGKNRTLLEKRKPKLARMFKEEDDDFRDKMKKWKDDDRKLREEKDKKEKELDKKGRWKYENCSGEYFWSIPDENGHMKSLEQYNQECEAKDQKEREAKEAMLTPEEKEEKKRKALEKKKREKEEEERMLEIERRYFEQERRQERNRKQKERRDKQKEELSRPITMPESVEKGKYEEIRDETIRQRHDAMKLSGLFTERDLAKVLKTIV